jgi:hypothetical protein
MKNMTKKLVLFMIFIFLMISIIYIPITKSSDASSASYDVGSYHTGLAGENASSTNYDSRFTTTYQQPGDLNASSTDYVLNAGWFAGGATNVWIEITFSDNLSAGILYGDADANTQDNNATGNVMSGSTQYNVTAGAANNVDIDLCLKDDTSLTKGGDTIGNGNYTYNFSATANGPALPGTAISTTYAKTQHTKLPAGVSSYSRFWLDVPGTQVAGTYSNTIYLKAIQNELNC